MVYTRAKDEDLKKYNPRLANQKRALRKWLERLNQDPKNIEAIKRVKEIRERIHVLKDARRTRPSHWSHAGPEGSSD